jgi:hypothetical protein
VEIGGTAPSEIAKKAPCQVANVMYADFWRHANDKGEDLEAPGKK